MRAELFGGDGNDELVGNRIGDVVHGGAGVDDLRGQEGNDVIWARDGEADKVSCGEGDDQVASDPVDDVAPDCEAAYSGAEPAPPAGPPPPPVEPPAAAPFDMQGSEIVPFRLRRSLQRGLPVGVQCTETCDVVAKLVVGTRTARRLKLRRRTVGRLYATLGQGTHVLYVPLGAPAARARRMRSLVVGVRVLGHALSGPGERSDSWQLRVSR